MNSSQAQQRLATLLDGPLPALSPLPPPGTEFVIYGAGNCGRDVLRVQRTHGCRVAAFLDARADSLGTMDDVVCVRPDTDQARAYARSGCPVVMGIFNYAVDPGPIYLLLQQTGFRRIISYYDLSELFPDSLRSRYWLTPCQTYAYPTQELQDALNLWADDRSRHIYD